MGHNRQEFIIPQGTPGSDVTVNNGLMTVVGILGNKINGSFKQGAILGTDPNQALWQLYTIIPLSNIPNIPAPNVFGYNAALESGFNYFMNGGF